MDGFNFLVYCNECQEKRSVSCSQSKAQTGNAVSVIAIVCGHTQSPLVTVYRHQAGFSIEIDTKAVPRLLFRERA